jgi:hypothetical protein
LFYNIGLKVKFIDISFFSLYNLLVKCFEDVLPPDSIFGLVNYKDKVISIMIFESGCAVFFRCKKVSAENMEEENIICKKEIESSITFYEERWYKKVSHFCIIGIDIISSLDEKIVSKNIILFSSIRDRIPLLFNWTEDFRLLSAIGVADAND